MRISDWSSDVCSSDFKESGDEAPDVLLCLSDDGDACANLGGDAPVIRLRASVAAAGADDDTIYRYDRQALLDALRRRVGESGDDGEIISGRAPRRPARPPPQSHHSFGGYGRPK